MSKDMDQITEIMLAETLKGSGVEHFWCRMFNFNNSQRSLPTQVKGKGIGQDCIGKKKNIAFSRPTYG